MATFLLRSHYQTFTGCLETIFVFEQDGIAAHRARNTVAVLERDVRNALSSISACVRVGGTF